MKGTSNSLLSAFLILFVQLVTTFVQLKKKTTRKFYLYIGFLKSPYHIWKTLNFSGVPEN